MKKSLSLAALFYSVLLFEPVFAADSFWKTNFGDWTNAANWSSGAVPTAVDWAIIDNGGQANLTAASAKVDRTWVGYFYSGGTLLISNAGTLTTSIGYIGYSSSGNKAVVTGAGSLWTNSKVFYVGNQGNGNSLVVSNGGALISGAGGGASYIGDASSNNTVLVTGTGSLWQNNDDLYIGTSVLGMGSLGNTLVVSNGGKVVSANLSGFGNFGGYTYIGYGALAPGNSALITGTDSLLTNARSLVVGQVSGGNSLVVSNGGKVANADLFIGYTNVATNNSVQVTGTGSLLTNSGNMYVGAGSRSIYVIAPHGGYNSLTIADGGTAASVDGFIGYADFASYNTVQVTGTNSLWTNSRDLYVGFSGCGNRLVITNGGEVFAGGNLVISAQAGATNTYFFDNPTNSVSVGGGRLVVTNGQINVGAATPGALYITGGTVEAKTLTATNGTNSVIAFNGGAINSSATAINNGTNFTIGDTGSGAAFTARVGTHTFASDLVVGNTGSSNSLVITNGGEVFIGTNMVLSAQAGASNNSVSISSGRLVVTNGTLEIGRAGSGALNVTGGSVEVKTLLATNGTNSVIALNGGTIVSQSTTVSNGASFVIGNTGSGASFIANGGVHNFASSTVVGNSGSSNSLVVSNGGRVAIGDGSVGFITNSSGNSILVTGTGSLLTNSGALSVGYQGSSNSLVISNAGTVVNLLGYVGIFGFSSNNSVLVTGSNSLWNNGLALFIGGTNNSSSGNSMVVSNGGLVTVGIDSFIGSGSSSNNTALVTGAGSRWTSGGITVGAEGRGNSLTISNAGVASSANGNIGSATNSSGNSALVAGANSLWTNSQNLRVGYEGRGNSLVISNGGRVANVEGSIGYTVFSSNNSALVTGANSVWTNSGYFYVGAYGSSNSLVVSNGGTVAALISQIGTFGSSLNNNVLVTGTNTLFNNALYLFVGGAGNSGNSMVVSNGGLVTVGIHSYIGGDVPADNNNVLVTGAGSRWSNAFGLFVGNAGLSNILTVANGGNASAGSGLTIAASNGSVATLNIGRFGTNDTAGTITAPSIAFGAGTGAINFNQSDATTISSAISGNGAVKQLGAGTTTLSASNTYTGDTTISAGTLRFSAENGAGASRILQTTLASLVEFLGGGRLTNQMTVFQYSFANSLETAGQVTLADAASSIAVASGATVTGSGSFIGTGGLTKKGAGTLSLTAANSFNGPLSVQAGTLGLAATSGSAAASVSSIGVTNGATLLVSQSHQVNNSAAVTLSGGTIARGSGVSEVFGNLNLTQASFLDFGTGAAGNLTFGTYAPSALLTINNFNVVGTMLVFGSDLRSSITNSSLFTFSNGGIASSSWNQATSTFTITAIPEPSAFVAAIGLLALMLWPLRRRLRAKVS